MSTRMSGADTAWLRMERPTNPMVITGVLIFKTRLDLARMKQALRRLAGAWVRGREHHGPGLRAGAGPAPRSHAVVPGPVELCQSLAFISEPCTVTAQTTRMSKVIMIADHHG